MYSRNEHIINQLHFNKNKLKKKENPHGSKVKSAPKGVLPTQPPSSPVQSHPTVSPPHSNLFPLVINLVSFWFPLPIFLFAKKKKDGGGIYLPINARFLIFCCFLHWRSEAAGTQALSFLISSFDSISWKSLIDRSQASSSMFFTAAPPYTPCTSCIQVLSCDWAPRKVSTLCNDKAAMNNLMYVCFCIVQGVSVAEVPWTGVAGSKAGACVVLFAVVKFLFSTVAVIWILPGASKSIDFPHSLINKACHGAFSCFPIS